jgi:DNA-binding CsgD family transcriptional regulator
MATTAEMAVRLLDHMRAMDVRDVLPSIRAPTLVLHNRRDQAVPAEAGREVSALVPGAELQLLDGNEHDPFIRDSGSVVEEILAFMAGRAPRAPAPPDRPATALSPREEEVLRLIADGAANKQIASTLGITLATVERHVTNLYRKVGAQGRADAAMAAVAMGLVSPLEDRRLG